MREAGGLIVQTRRRNDDGARLDVNPPLLPFPFLSDPYAAVSRLSLAREH